MPPGDAAADSSVADAAPDTAVGDAQSDAPVADASVAVTGISVDPSIVLVDQYGRAAIEVTATLEGGDTQVVESGVSVTGGNTSIASLSGLDIVGVGPGTTTLTLSYQGTTATLDVGVRAVYRVISEPSEFFEHPEGFDMGSASSDNSVTFVISEGDAYEGSESLKITYTGTQAWGGVYMYVGGAVDVSAFADGHLVLHVLAASSLGSIFVKPEWTGIDPGYPGVPLSDYTPSTTLAGWLTYEIPLADFASIDLSSITHFGFWNPCRPDDCADPIAQAYMGTVTIDGLVLRGPTPAL